jgi:hypothetical protein
METQTETETETETEAETQRLLRLGFGFLRDRFCSASASFGIALGSIVFLLDLGFGSLWLALTRFGSPWLAYGFYSGSVGRG